jgi:hypothetical protein
MVVVIFVRLNYGDQEQRATTYLSIIKGETNARAPVPRRTCVLSITAE